jgi:hypothetical protein
MALILVFSSFWDSQAKWDSEALPRTPSQNPFPEPLLVQGYCPNL